MELALAVSPSPALLYLEGLGASDSADDQAPTPGALAGPSALRTQGRGHWCSLYPSWLFWRGKKQAKMFFLFSYSTQNASLQVTKMDEDFSPSTANSEVGSPTDASWVSSGSIQS